MSTNQLPEYSATATPKLHRVQPIESRPPMSFEPDRGTGQDYMSVTALWDILLKRRWTVVTVAVVLSTLVAISTFRTKPVYKASARVQVEAEVPLIQSLNDLYESQQNWDMDDAFLQTQIEVLKSDTLAWRTSEELRLSDKEAFEDASAHNLPDEQHKERLISTFKSGLTVQLVPKTRMLLVSYESTDPELAARISNSLVNNYIDYNFRQKYDSSRQASGWMEQQLDELKAKVEKSQEAMVAYERDNSLVGAGDKENVQEQMLSDLSKDLTTAQSERILKESLYNQVRSNPTQTARLANDELLQRLEEKQADLKNQYTEAITQFGPNHPKALRLNEQLADIHVQIEQEQNRVIERIHGDYVTALDREALARSAVDKQKEELGKLNLLLVEHNILKRDFETSQQLYQNLLQRLKDATVSAGMRSTNIHLVDPAMTPIAPIRPRKLLNMMVGVLAGIILGIMIAFAQEALDQSIKSVQDVETLLGSQTLGIIPVQRLARPAYSLARKSATSDKVSVGLVSVAKPRSMIAEAFRALRTAILLSNSQPPKTILVTSAKSGEGKTVTSLNLAEVMAQRKGPVVVVDCDLRKSGLASAIGISNEKGMTGILEGGSRLEDALQSHPMLPGLSVLAAGPSVTNPAELLSSDRMLELLDQLKQRFECVILDSPPVLAVTDAAILSPLVDGVVLVVEGRSTLKGALARTHYTVASSGGNILGVVFNKYDPRSEGAYGYGSYYHYAYSPHGENS